MRRVLNLAKQSRYCSSQYQVGPLPPPSHQQWPSRGAQSLFHTSTWHLSAGRQASSGSGSSDNNQAGDNRGRSSADRARKGTQTTKGPLAGSRKSANSMSRKNSLNNSNNNNNNPPQSSTAVRLDRNANRFVLDLGHNQVARIDFKLMDQNTFDLYHSEVPAELRGRGIGKALARGAFERAAQENVRLKLTCTYLAHCMERFADPKYRKLVVGVSKRAK